MPSNDAIGDMFEMAKWMTILLLWHLGWTRPVFCKETALLMTYLVMEYAGLHFKIYGIIWFSRFVWFVMYWTSIMTLVQVAINPLKG